MASERGSKRLASLKRLVERKERDAAARFGQERRARDQALMRLEELRLYREEYLARHAQTTQQVGAAARLRDYQVFMDKLERAIAEQEAIIQQHSDRCHVARTDWTTEYTNNRTIETVIQRKREDEQRELARSEQRQLDDRNPRNGGTG